MSKSLTVLKEGFLIKEQNNSVYKYRYTLVKYNPTRPFSKEELDSSLFLVVSIVKEKEFFYEVQVLSHQSKKEIEEEYCNKEELDIDFSRMKNNLWEAESEGEAYINHKYIVDYPINPKLYFYYPSTGYIQEPIWPYIVEEYLKESK